ncbi:MAG: patatin-like phospholipase family protein [Calditrichota bacterium]
MKPQLLFAGQGGGSWGCFQAGALHEYFAASQTPAYDGGFGVSVGALTVSQLMSADQSVIPDRARQQQNVNVLREFWLERITGDDSIYRSWPKKKGRTLLLSAALSLIKIGESSGVSKRDLQAIAVAVSENKPSAYDNAPLIQLVRDALAGRHWHPSIKVGLVNMRTGRYEERTLADNPEWLDNLIASTVIPLAFPPVCDQFDGGVTDVTPLKGVFARFRELRRQSPDCPQELHVYRCSPFPRYDDTGHSYTNLPAVLFRLIEIMVDNTDREDYTAARFRNEISMVTNQARAAGNDEVKRKMDLWREKYGEIAIYVIGPTDEDIKRLPVNSRSFDPEKLKSGFLSGRTAMQKFLADKEKFRLENLLPL